MKNLRRQVGSSLPVGLLESLIFDAFKLARSAQLPGDAYNEGKGYLFQLARRLMRHFPEAQRPQIGTVLSPIALVFIEVLSTVKDLPATDINWSDAEDVQIAFEAEWGIVKFAEGEDLLKAALVRAKREPCVRESGRLGLIISTGYHLQERNGGKSFLLPINDESASLFGISRVQLSKYVTVAIDRSYFKVLRDHIPHVKAREFRFNTKHPDLLSSFQA